MTMYWSLKILASLGSLTTHHLKMYFSSLVSIELENGSTDFANFGLEMFVVVQGR